MEPWSLVYIHVCVHEYTLKLKWLAFYLYIYMYSVCVYECTLKLKWFAFTVYIYVTDHLSHIFFWGIEAEVPHHCAQFPRTNQIIAILIEHAKCLPPL